MGLGKSVNFLLLDEMFVQPGSDRGMLSPQQQKSGDTWKRCPSLWKASAAQPNMQREYGHSPSWGQPISEGDLYIAFLSGSREEKMMGH